MADNNTTKQQDGAAGETQTTTLILDKLVWRALRRATSDQQITMSDVANEALKAHPLVAEEMRRLEAAL